MQKRLLRFLPILLLLLFVGQVQAKTLVYCSEGSPEGFNPSLYTAGTRKLIVFTGGGGLGQ